MYQSWRVDGWSFGARQRKRLFRHTKVDDQTRDNDHDTKRIDHHHNRKRRENNRQGTASGSLRKGLMFNSRQCIVASYGIAAFDLSF